MAGLVRGIFGLIQVLMVPLNRPYREKMIEAMKNYVGKTGPPLWKSPEYGENEETYKN
jgi:hypothetical protein